MNMQNRVTQNKLERKLWEIPSIRGSTRAERVLESMHEESNTSAILTNQLKK
jgi:hypothetical protein